MGAFAPYQVPCASVFLFIFPSARVTWPLMIGGSSYRVGLLGRDAWGAAISQRVNVLFIFRVDKGNRLEIYGGIRISWIRGKGSF